ncbi:MAG TPA: glycosyltransferase family 4 protein [Steroidobacteraceae bacterium]
MATEVSGTLSLVPRDAPGGFTQAVASAILGETPGSPVRPLSTVAEMCAAISTVYDAIAVRPAVAARSTADDVSPAQAHPGDDSTGSVPADGAISAAHDVSLAPAQSNGDSASAVSGHGTVFASGAARVGRQAAPLPDPLALWVVAVPDLGGVARHVLDAARAGVPGYRLMVVCPEGPLAATLRAQGCAVVTAPISPADPLPQGIAALRRTIRSLRPAVVHSHLAYSDFVAAGAAVGSGARLVTTEHGIAGDDLVYHGTALRSRVMAAAHHVRLRRFDALIAVSEATLEAVRTKWRPTARLRIWVIPNGVDVPARAYEPVPGRFHVVSLARLAPEKGLTDLVEAFALVRAARPEATLTLAGEGPLRADLERKVADLGLANAVSLPGYVDAAGLLASADVLAQLSVWENCSYSLLDALAAGLTAVATPFGGNQENQEPRTPPSNKECQLVMNVQ